MKTLSQDISEPWVHNVGLIRALDTYAPWFNRVVDKPCKIKFVWLGPIFVPSYSKCDAFSCKMQFFLQQGEFAISAAVSSHLHGKSQIFGGQFLFGLEERLKGDHLSRFFPLLGRCLRVMSRLETIILLWTTRFPADTEKIMIRHFLPDFTELSDSFIKSPFISAPGGGKLSSW